MKQAVSIVPLALCFLLATAQVHGVFSGSHDRSQGGEAELATSTQQPSAGQGASLIDKPSDEAQKGADKFLDRQLGQSAFTYKDESTSTTTTAATADTTTTSQHLRRLEPQNASAPSDFKLASVEMKHAEASEDDRQLHHKWCCRGQRGYGCGACGAAAIPAVSAVPAVAAVPAIPAVAAAPVATGAYGYAGGVGVGKGI